jgi:hypothetical protein
MAYTWFILLLAVVGTALFLLLLHGTSLGQALHEGIPDRPRRRLFVASVSFFLTFAGVRAVVYGVVHNIPPFHFVQVGGRHIHHLVFGITILLLVGYGWLCEVGNGSDRSSIFVGRLMSILYGVGAALTLDEFALWLNLRDVYWAREGRSSIDAVFCLARCWPRARGVLPCGIGAGRKGSSSRRSWRLRRKPSRLVQKAERETWPSAASARAGCPRDSQRDAGATQTVER